MLKKNLILAMFLVVISHPAWGGLDDELPAFCHPHGGKTLTVAEIIKSHPGSPHERTVGISHQHGASGRKFFMRYSDTNHDGKPNFIEEFSEVGDLLCRWVDRNFDGKIDRIEAFSNKEAVIYVDYRFRDLFELTLFQERKGTFLAFVPPGGGAVRRFFIPAKQETADPARAGGHALTVPEDTRPFAPPRGKGNEAPGLPGLRSLFSKDPQAAAEADPSGEFQKTDFGVMVHSDCAKQLGEGANEFVRQTLKEGASCLEGLAGTGARTNLVKLSDLLANKDAPLKIRCSDDAKLAETELGHATARRADPSFPTVHINTRALAGAEPDATVKNLLASNNAEKTNDAKSTLFHEAMHTLEYAHDGNSIEYPYACSDCCFPKKRKVRSIGVLGCQICSGAYSSPDDPKYLKDLVEWAKKSRREDFARKRIERHIGVDTTDAESYARLIELTEDRHAQYGLAVALKTQFPHYLDRLSPEGKAAVERALDVGQTSIPLYRDSLAKLGSAELSLLQGDLYGAHEDLLPVPKPQEGSSKLSTQNQVGMQRAAAAATKRRIDLAWALDRQVLELSKQFDDAASKKAADDFSMHIYKNIISTPTPIPESPTGPPPADAP